jgi:hypothetical protein
MSALGSDNEDSQLGSENGNGSENENSGSGDGIEKVLDQNDENWVPHMWRSICCCTGDEMEDCVCVNRPLLWACQDGKWHDDVQRVMNELAGAKLLDIDELSDVAHFALETLPVQFAVECLEIFRVGGRNPSKRMCEAAETLRKRHGLYTHDEPDIYRTRVKAPVCNGSAAVSAAVVSVAAVSAAVVSVAAVSAAVVSVAVVSDDVVVISDDAVVVCNGGPAPNATESKNEDAGASVGEKKKRSTSLAELETKLKRNKAAIDKNTEEFHANRAAVVILNKARKVMLDEKKTKKANQKPKKPNQKPKKPNQKPKKPKKDNKKA